MYKELFEKENLTESQKETVEKLDVFYEEMKNMSGDELADILEEDFKENLLCICGGLFSEDRVMRCQMALILIHQKLREM